MPKTSLEAVLAEEKRRDLKQFVARAKPRYRWYPHCECLRGVLGRVMEGQIRRLMIVLPPRHGKSELVSRLLTGHYLMRYPERWVGLVCYGSELAMALSRAARENYVTAGGLLNPAAQAVTHWETARRGGLWAAGMGGTITGKGFHLGIIDDPVKNAEEAASEVIREKHREWYQSTFYTREEPGGAIIVIQTRWNADDLTGWLLAQEEDDEPERWHVVFLPAVREEIPVEWPSTITLEPDWREMGEALCPDRYPLAKLGRIRRRIGSYYWNALYAGWPTAREGGLFQRKWLEQAVIHRLPEAA